MPIEFSLRRAFHLGKPVPRWQAFLEARGAFYVAEAVDPLLRRLVPCAHEELHRTERLLARAVNRLRETGTPVDMLPGGGMRIAGETPAP